MRLTGVGKVAHHTEAYKQQTPVGRCSRHRQKDKALTWGGLGLDSVFLYTKKSAEAIVAIGNEPRIDTVEVSQDSEGLNVELSEIR